MERSNSGTSQREASIARGHLRAYNSRYFLVRISGLIIVFFLVLVINFILPRLMPGNFADTYIAELLKDNVRGINVNLLTAQINKLFGTNLPLSAQFILYLKEVLQFPPNFGPSFEYYPVPAWNIVMKALPWTFMLLIASQIPAWALGEYFGVYLAKNKGKKMDKIFQPILWFVNSFPTFFIGIILILLFAIDFKILPAFGAYSSFPDAISVSIHAILPVLTLIIGYFPVYTIVSRSAALDILSSDFATSLRAQGLSLRLLMKKIVRNTVLPSLSQLFMTLGILIGYIFVVEYAFSYPGIGTVIENAILTHDFPVLEASLYVAALMVLFGNLIADLLYPLIDPRVSYAKRA